MIRTQNPFSSTRHVDFDLGSPAIESSRTNKRARTPGVRASLQIRSSCRDLNSSHAGHPNLGDQDVSSSGKQDIARSRTCEGYGRRHTAADAREVAPQDDTCHNFTHRHFSLAIPFASIAESMLRPGVIMVLGDSS
jgi:hypothetical protein